MSRSFRAAGEEAGFAIVEVVVSAAVLAIVALAVLSGIDGATGSSAREKARAVAASLAEQDQERLRAMSVETLAAVPQAAPVTVDGITYRIESRANWVTDDTGGTPACGNSGNRSEYVHITSTVTSNTVGARIPPVAIDSLVSPSVAYSQQHGTLGVKIVDRKGDGRAGISVSGRGPSALATQTTDQDGCVIWRSILIGTYTVSVTGGGCDENGDAQVERDQIVSPNTVSFVTIRYDQCVEATVAVKTHVPGRPFSTDPAAAKPSKATTLSDSSSNGTLKSWTLADPAAEFKPLLFPHLTAYGFFSGRCEYQSPVTYGLTDYFAATNPAASLIADPEQPAAVATVYQPPVQIRIGRTASTSSSDPPAAGRMSVKLTLVTPAAYEGDACADTFQLNVQSWPASWGPRPAGASDDRGWVSRTGDFDPGLPFGEYTICLYDTVNRRYYKHRETYDNTDPAGGALLQLSPAATRTLTEWTSTPC